MLLARANRRWIGAALGAASISCSGQILAPSGLLNGDASTNPDSDGGFVLPEGSIFEVGGDGIFSGGMKLSPDNAVGYIDTSTGLPATLAYTATLDDGTDVTSTTTFSIDDTTVGSFSGATFTSTLTLPGPALGLTVNVRGVGAKANAGTKLTLVKFRKTPDPAGQRDFFFVVPYKEAPTPPKDVLKFGTKIQKVDVAFVMDTTGSMSGEINNLKSTLSSTIIPGLVTAIPDVGIAVVDHKDSDCDAVPVRVATVVTTDIPTAQAAVASMSAGGGCDLPEAQVAAMLFALTGEAISTNPPIAAHASPAGFFGGVDFRPGAVPVVVLISDASWHDPSGSATTSALDAAFTAHNAKFVGIFIGTGDSTSVPQGTALSDATHSNLPASAMPGGTCPTTSTPSGACRLNYSASASGTGVDTSVVKAIEAIAVGSVYDVRAAISNDPTNANGPDGKPVDATAFIAQLRAMDEGSSADGCAPHEAYASPGSSYKDTFKAVVVGDSVCFEVVAQQNTTVPPTDSAQFFNAFIDMKGEPGDVNLGDRRTVVFLVPPKEDVIH